MQMCPPLSAAPTPSNLPPVRVGPTPYVWGRRVHVWAGPGQPQHCPACLWRPRALQCAAGPPPRRTWRRRYFRRLQKRYAPAPAVATALRAADAATPAAGAARDAGGAARDAGGAHAANGAAGGDDASLTVPITCVNLLRCNMQARAPERLAPPAVGTGGLVQGLVMWMSAWAPRIREQTKCGALVRSHVWH